MSASMWDVQVRQMLGTAGSRFKLDVAFRSAAQRLVLHGRSGAGKTQTLRLMAGIAQAASGHVKVAGQVLFDSTAGIDLPAQHRRLAVVFQDYALFPHLSVQQNLGFARKRGWRNPSRSERDPEVERWLQSFELESVAHLLPHQLSGGQKQRAALARALLASPRALLLDEPFAAVDAPLRQRLREELLALQRQLQVPMLLISHDDEDLRVFAQDVVRIDNGQVLDRPAPSRG